MAGYRETYRPRLMSAGGQMRDADAQAIVLDAVCAGHVPPSTKGKWQQVETTDGKGHRAIFHLQNDALKIGTEDDYVRPLVTHETLQAAADVLGMAVPTKKILDAAADQASMQIDAMGYTIPGKRQTGTRGTGQDFVRPESASGLLPWTVAVQDEESDRMDAMSRKLNGGLSEPPPFLGFNQIGKTWASAAKMSAPAGLRPYGKKSGINHGFYNGANYTPTGAVTKKWAIGQNIGAAHDWSHTDYSQRGWLVHRTVWVTGPGVGDKPVAMDIDKVAQDPQLQGLIWEGSHVGAVRHPWLPFYDCGGGGEGGINPDEDPGASADPFELPWGKSDQTAAAAGRGSLMAWALAAAAAAAAYAASRLDF